MAHGDLILIVWGWMIDKDIDRHDCRLFIIAIMPQRVSSSLDRLMWIPIIMTIDSTV